MNVSDSHLHGNDECPIESELLEEEWKGYLYEQFNAVIDVMNPDDGSDPIIRSLNSNLSFQQTIALF